MAGLSTIPARIDDGTGALGPIIELKMLVSTSRAAAVLQRVLVKIRYLSLDGVASDRLALMLDYAEAMAAHIAKDDNRQQEFEQQLQGLAERFPDFSGIWNDYEQGRL